LGEAFDAQNQAPFFHHKIVNVRSDEHLALLPFENPGHYSTVVPSTAARITNASFAILKALRIFREPQHDETIQIDTASRAWMEKREKPAIRGYKLSGKRWTLGHRDNST
jgi:hypothetical protein